MTGLAVGLSFLTAPLVGTIWHVDSNGGPLDPAWAGSFPLLLLLCFLGVLILTALMHLARAVARAHARVAKRLLVTPG